MRLGDDDRAPPVGGEVEVVGVGDRHRACRAAGARVDRRQAVALVVGDPQRPAGPTTASRAGAARRRRSGRRPCTCAGRSRRPCSTRSWARRRAPGRARTTRAEQARAARRRRRRGGRSSGGMRPARGDAHAAPACAGRRRRRGVAAGRRRSARARWRPCRRRRSRPAQRARARASASRLTRRGSSDQISSCARPAASRPPTTRTRSPNAAGAEVRERDGQPARRARRGRSPGRRPGSSRAATSRSSPRPPST